MHTSIEIPVVICNKQATDRSIDLINRLQHARHEHQIVVASVYERLNERWRLQIISSHSYRPWAATVQVVDVGESQIVEAAKQRVRSFKPDGCSTSNIARKVR
jgi:hypothetical protein